MQWTEWSNETFIAIGYFGSLIKL